MPIPKENDGRLGLIRSLDEVDKTPDRPRKASAPHEGQKAIRPDDTVSPTPSNPKRPRPPRP